MTIYDYNNKKYWKKIGSKIEIDGAILFVGDFALDHFCMVNENCTDVNVKLPKDEYIDRLNDNENITDKVAEKMELLDHEITKLFSDKEINREDKTREIKNKTMELSYITKKLVLDQIELYVNQE